MLNDNVFINSLTVDQFDNKIFGLEFVRMYPGSHLDALTETKLPLSLPFYIKTSGIFFYHASHTEGWCAGSNCLLHKGNPGMRNTVRASIVVNWSYLLL